MKKKRRKKPQKTIKKRQFDFKKNDVSVVGENNLPFWSFNS